MSLEITKTSVDVGIVVRDADKAVTFYGGVLGLPADAMPKMPMPGGTMHRFLAGESVVKLLSFEAPPDASNPPGGIAGGSGFRYFTITVSNLDAAAEAAREAGHTVPMGPLDLAPGVRICMIEDPDGNWVELLQMGT